MFIREIIMQNSKIKLKNNGAGKKRDPIPENFDSLEAAADFWDTHDLTEYCDEFRTIEGVKVELNGQPLRLESELAEKIGKVARRRGISAETLVHLWLQKKLSEILKRDRRRLKRISQNVTGAK